MGSCAVLVKAVVARPSGVVRTRLGCSGRLVWQHHAFMVGCGRASRQRNNMDSSSRLTDLPLHMLWAQVQSFL